MWRDLKYLSAYSLPFMVALGVYFQGVFTFLTPVYAFVCIPILETLLPADSRNLQAEERKRKAVSKIFDGMLYGNIPIVYAMWVINLYVLLFTSLTVMETVGILVSQGILIGSNGINVAHELGHREKWWERFLGKTLLLPSFYNHFYVEHNWGHHLNVGTPEDPATAKVNQTVYSFWYTSVTRQYVNAWHIQKKLLSKENLPFWHIRNDMLGATAAQVILLVIVFGIGGVKGVFFTLCMALISFLLLETINYIEHYGLIRQKTASGRYERVREIHSWNSNHIIGRMVLYELTRHSDHHFRASKHYQLLDYHDESPQLPFGYPTSMVIALVPPLWFRWMNHRIPETMKASPLISPAV